MKNRDFFPTLQTRSLETFKNFLNSNLSPRLLDGLPELLDFGRVIDLTIAKLLKEKISPSNIKEYEKLVEQLEDMMTRMSQCQKTHHVGYLENKIKFFENAKIIIQNKINFFKNPDQFFINEKSITSFRQNIIKIKGLVKSHYKTCLDHNGAGLEYEHKRMLIKAAIDGIEDFSQQFEALYVTRYKGFLIQQLSEINYSTDDIIKKISYIERLLNLLDEDCQTNPRLQEPTNSLRNQLEDLKIDYINQRKNEIYEVGRNAISQCKNNKRNKIFKIEANILAHFNQLNELCKLTKGCGAEQQHKMNETKTNLNKDISSFKQHAERTWHMKNKISPTNRWIGGGSGLLTGLTITAIITLLAFPPTGLAALIGGGIFGTLGLGYAIGATTFGAVTGVGSAIQGCIEGYYHGKISSGFMGGIKGAMKGLVTITVGWIGRVACALGANPSSIGFDYIYSTNLRDSYEQVKKQVPPSKGVASAESPAPTSAESSAQAQAQTDPTSSSTASISKTTGGLEEKAPTSAESPAQAQAQTGSILATTGGLEATKGSLEEESQSTLKEPPKPPV